MARLAISSWNKMVLNGKLVYLTSKIRLGVPLIPSYPLANLSWSELGTAQPQLIIIFFLDPFPNSDDVKN